MKTVRTLPAILGLTLLGTACAHVGQDEYRADMTAMQARIAEIEGDTDLNAAAIAEVVSRLDLTEAETAELRADLTALGREFDVRIDDLEAQVAFAVPVYFDFDESRIGAEGEAVLETFASVARRWYPEATITVEGFTDAIGSVAYNERLGMRRAEAVKSTLVALGLPGERLRAVSYGESETRLVRPGEAGPGAGRENRRVTLVIEHSPEARAVVTEQDAPAPATESRQGGGR